VEAQSSMAGDCATMVQWLKAINRLDIRITVGNEITIIAETVAKSRCDQGNMVIRICPAGKGGWCCVKRRSGGANDGCDLFGRSWEPTHTPHYGLISTRCEAAITHLVTHQCVAAKLSLMVSLRNSLDRYDKGGLIMIVRYGCCMRPKIVPPPGAYEGKHQAVMKT
jgi:hypothetical protein